MESTDWAFNTEVIDLGDFFYIGEVNTNNQPNGYGITLNKSKNKLCECYWVDGKGIYKTLVLTDTMLRIGMCMDGQWEGLVIDQN